ncbi:MAG TPA: asparagine synthase (glutamine-hydrolyzing), partial [Pyrinomonadaceae bacterium]
MCGIAGIISASGEREPESGARGAGLREALARMVKYLDHRGPDDRGLSVLSPKGCEVGLGHTRLSILDLSTAGHQPMSDPRTGNQITYNGEVYNFRELRGALGEGPDAWRSQSDTEVILRAYQRDGRECLENLRGMFAFGLWDAGRRKLLLARDRLGIKPLYYYAGRGFFLFASEVKALLESGLVPRRLDRLGLWHYLAYQSVPAPRTLVEGVRALEPGSWMTVDERGEREAGCYWNMLSRGTAEARDAAPAESRRRVRELLHEAVALNLVSDVPVGAFLSGGLDSSAVVALMREAGAAPRTFTVGFAESGYDEASQARRTAAHFQTVHTEIRLTQERLLEQLPEALAVMDQPTGDGLNTYVVARAVREQGIKVALSGLGGDEFFAGYPSFTRLKRMMRYGRWWGGTPLALRSLAA